MTKYSSEQYPLQDETKIVIGIGYDVYRNLGRGFLEIVYKDALEYELKNKDIEYTREKEYSVAYKNIILPHKYFADFVIQNNIILEVKAQVGIAEEHYTQTINYLKVSGCKVGLILNFGEDIMKIKRIVL